MHKQQTIGWLLLTLVSSSSIVSTFAYPNQMSQPVYITSDRSQMNRIQNPTYQQQSPVYAQERKFAEKPNALKKVALDDIDADISTNQIQESGFSWSNVLGVIMQMIFNGGQQSPTKSDGLDDNSLSPSPWANILTMGLKILTAVLGGTGDNIDKVDNGSSPMQGILAAVLTAIFGARDPNQVATMAKQAGEFINIIVNLLDALKTSFSHRSLAARNIGKKDSISDATVAGITMLKGYMRTLGTSDDQCTQMYVCEANRECTSDIGPSSIFCQFGTYAASFLLQKPSENNSDSIFEAGRRGRAGSDCRRTYHDCNEV